MFEGYKGRVNWCVRSDWGWYLQILLGDNFACYDNFGGKNLGKENWEKIVWTNFWEKFWKKKLGKKYVKIYLFFYFLDLTFEISTIKSKFNKLKSNINGCPARAEHFAHLKLTRFNLMVPKNWREKNLVKNSAIFCSKKMSSKWRISALSGVSKR